MADIHTDYKTISTMKYTHDNHVRMILLWGGMLGFDTYKQAEKAILENEDWYKAWDTSDWKVADVEYITTWRTKQLEANEVPTVSDTILSRYFGVKGVLN